jgi:hypothetical protein
MTSPKLNGFISIQRSLLAGEIWQSLSPGARALAIDMASWHNGHNNGQICYGYLRATQSLKCSRSTAARYFRELQSAGLVECTEKGSFDFKLGARKGTANKWKLHFIK